MNKSNNATINVEPCVIYWECICPYLIGQSSAYSWMTLHCVAAKSESCSRFCQRALRCKCSGMTEEVVARRVFYDSSHQDYEDSWFLERVQGGSEMDQERFCPAFNIQNMYDLCLCWVRLNEMPYIPVCFKYTEPFRVLALCRYFCVITAAQGVFLTTQLCCCTWTGELLSAVLVQQVIVASQCPWAVVVRPKAQEDVPVEGIVVLQRESVKKLEERLWQDEVPCVPHLKRGHGQNLVHPQKLGILQEERWMKWLRRRRKMWRRV